MDSFVSVTKRISKPCFFTILFYAPGCLYYLLQYCGMMSWEWLFRMLFKSAYGQLYFAFANFLRGCLVKWQLSGLGQSMVPGLIPAKQIYGFSVWFWPPIDLYMVFYWITVSFYAIYVMYIVWYIVFMFKCVHVVHYIFTSEYSVRGWLVKC